MLEPKRIPGSLKAEDSKQLVDLVEGKNVLQLGCYCGRATVVLSRHAVKVWVLEDFFHSEGIVGVTEELKSNIDRYAPPESEIYLLQGTADAWSVPEGSEDLQPGMVDVVYRDANRSEKTRGADDNLALHLLQRTGGVYAWHNDKHELKWLQIQPVPVEVN